MRRTSTRQQPRSSQLLCGLLHAVVDHSGDLRRDLNQRLLCSVVAVVRKKVVVPRFKNFILWTRPRATRQSSFGPVILANRKLTWIRNGRSAPSLSQLPVARNSITELHRTTAPRIKTHANSSTDRRGWLRAPE